MTDGQNGLAISGSQYDYSPYGVPLTGNSSLTNYRDTQQYRDSSTGLQYHRARWLNTSTASWLSTDPYFDFPNNFGNEYGYVGNNPVTGSDPSGLFTLVELVSVASIVATLVSIAVPSVAGILIAVKMGVSPWEYLAELFSIETWKEALIATGFGALTAGVIWLIAKKIALKYVSFIGLALSLWGLIESLKLTYSMATGKITRRGLSRYLAVMTATIIISAIVGKAAKNVGTVRQKSKHVVDFAKANNGRSPQHFQRPRRFQNRENRLPRSDRNGSPITYREYDVNPLRPGVNRGRERVVISSGGKVYVTNNHYLEFHQVFS